MHWFNNLKVGAKIGLLSLGSIAVLLIVGITGYISLNKASSALETMYSQQLTAVQFVNDSRTQSRKIEADIYAIIAAKDPALKNEFSNDIKTQAAAFNNNSANFEKLDLTSEQRTLYKQIIEELTAYRDTRSSIIELGLANKNEEALTLFITKGKPLSDKFNNDLTILSEQVKESAAQLNDKNKQTAKNTNLFFMVLIVISLIVIIGLSILIIKQITLRLNNFISYFEILADSDFSHPIDEKSLNDKTEFGKVSRTVDKMKNNIITLLRDLIHTIEQLAASSEELTATAEHSAQASDKIARAVSEVSSSSDNQLQAANNTSQTVQQIANAINQVASHAETVATSAKNTASAANSGEAAIKQAVTQMKTIETKTNATVNVINDLDEKSKQIGQIVDVIANISGQTNLLALNAAIEAASAGEAGKGFAIVAEEVRKLAEQSQAAAKQITDLINEVQSKTDNAVIYMNDGKKEVDAGAKVVEDAGSSFEIILSMVNNMSNQIHEISAAVQQITSGSHAAVMAVEKIDDEAKNNSAQTRTISSSAEEQASSSEEIASASEHLAKMAEDLEAAVHKFKI